MTTISTIPLNKLTVVINNFIANTITHLNKLSVKGDQKLSEFDNKLNDLDAMTTLLEAKLNSLPENITSTYPALQEVGLDDINPVIIPNPIPSGTGESVPPPPSPPPDPDRAELKTVPEEQKEEDQQEGNEEKGEEGNEDDLSPEEAMEKFLKANESLRTLYKMLKVGVPTMQVKMKAKMNEINANLVEELIERAKKINPSIS